MVRPRGCLNIASPNALCAMANLARCCHVPLSFLYPTGKLMLQKFYKLIVNHPDHASVAVLRALLFTSSPHALASIDYTDSMVKMALLMYTHQLGPLLINNTTLAPNVYGNPIDVEGPLETIIGSYIINERPTCSVSHTPTLYTNGMQDAIRDGGKARDRVKERHKLRGLRECWGYRTRL